MKLKVGDQVVIISGADKGKNGVISKVIPKDNKVVVEGINVRTRHIKPSQSHPDGGIEKESMPIYVSKVMANITENKKDVAVGSRVKVVIENNKNGKKEKKRISVKTGEEI